MSAQTNPPHIPTGQELYDALMEHVEPELVTANLASLDEKYKNETPPEKAARKKRYDLAFERYAQSYDGYMETLRAQVERFHRSAFQKAELQDRKVEEGLLSQLTTAMFPSAA